MFYHNIQNMNFIQDFDFNGILCRGTSELFTFPRKCLLLMSVLELVNYCEDLVQ